MNGEDATKMTHAELVQKMIVNVTLSLVVKRQDLSASAAVRCFNMPTITF